MSLIKKTLTLKNATNLIGHMTIIKIGDSTGIKLIVNSQFVHRTFAFIKTSTDSCVFFEIDAQKTERSCKLNFTLKDTIATMLMSDEFKLLAYGGDQNLIDIREFKTMISQYVISNEKKLLSESTSNVSNPSTTLPNSSKIKSQKTTNFVNKDNINYDQKRNADSFILALNSSFNKHIKTKLEELFKTNPPDKLLENAIPNSQWVKIKYQSKEYFSVGILKTDDIQTHMAYAVPGVDNIHPPEEIYKICKFVEVDSPNIKGYWMIVQNLKDGTIASK
ncbi:MAG: hypothetical protein LBF12_02550 [Christensenellaceae bacterium]|jgi:hypothetical protein|nr:hypothetical protein [Christensenellaceae bacterium]